MSLKQKILEDFKVAFKNKEAEKKVALSMLKSAIANREIELGKKEDGLDDSEVVEVVSKLVKQRKDSAEQYKNGGREDLAQKEEAEIEVLAVYLPKQLDDEEVKKIVEQTAAEIGVSGPGDMGKLMGAAMGKLKGKTDGNLVKKFVQEFLNSK
jgi:uncharacterized protein